MDYSQKIDGCKYFTWNEALILPSWKIHHIPSEKEKQNIINLAQTMDKIRDFLGVSINIHVWIRPILNNPESAHNGEDYNAFVSGAPLSAHRDGSAVDWDASGLNCDDVRSKLLHKLEEFNIRIEDKPLSNWVHCDNYLPNPHRFFKP